MGSDIQNVPYFHPRGQDTPIEVVRLSELRARKIDVDIAAPTRHDFYLFEFVTAGSGAHWVDFTRHALSKGDVLQIRPDQVHAFDADSRHEALLLVFRPEAVPEFQVQRLSVHPGRPFHLKPREFAFLIQVLELLLKSDQAPERHRLASLAPGLLQAVISGLEELYARHDDRPQSPAGQRAVELIYRFERLLHQRRERDSLAEYSELLHVTARTLARACHQIRGLSPKRLIDRNIALEAKRKLILGGGTVEEIGFDLGFSEATNFVKFFKRIVGQTPEAFRTGQRIQ